MKYTICNKILIEKIKYDIIIKDVFLKYIKNVIKKRKFF